MPELSNRHWCLGLAASAQLPSRVHPLSRARPERLAGYSPERLAPREAHQLLQLYRIKGTTKRPQTSPSTWASPPFGEWRPSLRKRTCRSSSAQGPTASPPQRPLQRPISPARIYPNLIGFEHPLSLSRTPPRPEWSAAERLLGVPSSCEAEPSPSRLYLSVEPIGGRGRPAPGASAVDLRAASDANSRKSAPSTAPGVLSTIDSPTLAGRRADRPGRRSDRPSDRDTFVTAPPRRLDKRHFGAARLPLRGPRKGSS